jgi:hypothetical protein
MKPLKPTKHQSRPDPQRPPVYTMWEEFPGWTFDRTAGIPKNQRFTFGQRIDAHSLDIMELIVRAVFSKEKQDLLHEINHRLELLRVLWRLVQRRGWISLRQLHFLEGKIDETGRMIGGWVKQIEGVRKKE